MICLMDGMSTPKTIADRLIKARKYRNLTQSELAVRADVGQSTIGGIESGKGQGRISLPKIAKALDISHDWLVDGVGSMTIPNPQQDDIVQLFGVHLQVYDADVSWAIDPATAHESLIAIKQTWLRKRNYNPKQLIAHEIQGRSMEPSMYPGDVVVINTADRTAMDGIIFAMAVEGQIMIRRLHREQGVWRMYSDNSDQRLYRPRDVDAGTHVVGRVIFKQSENI